MFVPFSQVFLYCDSQLMNYSDSGVIATMAKLARTSVLRITKDYLYLIIVDDSVPANKPVVWCLLEQTHYFNEYNMAGVSEEQNEIYLEFESGKSYVPNHNSHIG